jgi:hypothetical protein
MGLSGVRLPGRGDRLDKSVELVVVVAVAGDDVEGAAGDVGNPIPVRGPSRDRNVSVGGERPVRMAFGRCAGPPRGVDLRIGR